MVKGSLPSIKVSNQRLELFVISLFCLIEKKSLSCLFSNSFAVHIDQQTLFGIIWNLWIGNDSFILLIFFSEVIKKKGLKVLLRNFVYNILNSKNFLLLEAQIKFRVSKKSILIRSDVILNLKIDKKNINEPLWRHEKF